MKYREGDWEWEIRPELCKPARSWAEFKQREREMRERQQPQPGSSKAKRKPPTK